METWAEDKICLIWFCLIFVQPPAMYKTPHYVQKSGFCLQWDTIAIHFYVHKMTAVVPGILLVLTLIKAMGT